MLTNLNGTLVPTLQAKLPASDCSTLFGDSLFETIRVVSGRAVWLEEHLDRLASSAALLEIPCDTKRLTAETYRLLERLEKSLADLPAVDATRVAEVKAAIENGDYEIDADAIADAMIRFERSLGE